MTKQQQKDSGQFICIFPPLSIKGLYVILMTRSVLHTTNSHCGKSTTPGFNSLMESTFFFTISNIIFHFQAELVSHDCQDKVPQTRWLKTTEIYSLIVLEARSTESRCWQDHILSEDSQGESVPGLSLHLWCYQVSLAFLSLLLHSNLPLYMAVSLSLLRTRIRTKPSLLIVWPHLNGCEFEQAPGVGDGQGSLACCSPRSHKESDTTEWLNWTALN